MAITWTVVVFGALLHGIKCNSASLDSPGSTYSNLTSSLGSTPTTMQSPVSLLNSTSAASQVSTPPTILGSAGSNDSISTTNMNSKDNVPPATISTSLNSTAPTTLESTVSWDPTLTTSPVSTRSPDSTTRTSVDPTNSSSNLVTKEPPLQQNANDSSTLTEHNTTQNTAKFQPSTSATLTVSNHSPQNSPTVISSVNQVTTNSSILVTTTHNENGKTPLNQTNPSAVTTNSVPENGCPLKLNRVKPAAPYSKSTASQSVQTTEAQTTSAPITTALHPGHLDSATTTSTPGKITYKSFNLSSSSEGNVLLETCKTLAHNLKGNCLVSLEIQNKTLVATIKIIVADDQEIQTEIYKSPEQREEEREESIPDTLVAILASSGALVLILCCFAAYCTYHRRSYRKNQQHLTEELQTVENGYHDNPTLEVMEVVPEMQEKKLALNGEFNDSWIVPIDNLLKDDIPDEEDTHL